MQKITRWLFMTVMTLSLVGTVNVWTTEDLKEFEANWQDYPHHELGEGGKSVKKKVDSGSSWDDGDLSRADLTVGEELILVEKKVPEYGTLGEDFMIDMKVTALEDAANIVVKTSVPEGSTYVKSDPSGKLVGNEVIWTFDRMDKGDVKDIKVWFRPNGEGDFTSCTTATADPIACVLTKIRTPHLTISKSGDETALVGDEVDYTITVKNDGSAPAEDVVVTDFIPDGMAFDGSNEQASFELGTLDPGESESISIELDAMERGYFCNQAQVNSSNANSANAEACTQVMEQGIEVSKSGPSQTFVGKGATYSIRVRNTGDVTLTNVKVSDSHDRKTSLASDEDSWTIDSLAAGESRSFNITLNSDSVGNFCNTASASSNEGASDSAEACTEWQGHSAILMELIDVEDPLLIGEMTTYKVRITNQGSASDSNVKIKLMFPREVQPVSASGATAGSVSGSTVDFAAYDELSAGQTIEFFVEAKAVGKGDARIKLELDSDLLKRPVTEEESTHVY